MHRLPLHGHPPMLCLLMCVAQLVRMWLLVACATLWATCKVSQTLCLACHSLPWFGGCCTMVSAGAVRSSELYKFEVPFHLSLQRPAGEERGGAG